MYSKIEAVFKMRINYIFSSIMIGGFLFLSACSMGYRMEEQAIQSVTKQPSAEEQKQKTLDPSFKISKISYEELPSWGSDKVEEIMVPLLLSCRRIVSLPSDYELNRRTHIGGKASDWKELCATLEELKVINADSERVESFLKTNFTPFKIEGTSHYTGYYEYSLKGSKTADKEYKYPIYSRPHDLISINLGDFDSNLQGRFISGKLQGSRIVPYYPRKDITNGVLVGKGLELLYVDNYYDLYMMQVQGSGRIELPDSSVVRVGYAGKNGYPYTSIANILKSRGVLHKFSNKDIREYYSTHQEEMKNIMNENASYIFFREVHNTNGPIGAQGISLTPLRSIAIDSAYYGYGLPFWISVKSGDENNSAYSRIVVAQDTGGAIRGYKRADVFFGAGEEAKKSANELNGYGSMYVLIPNNTVSVIPEQFIAN